MEIFSKYILYVCVYNKYTQHTHIYIYYINKTFILDVINCLSALLVTNRLMIAIVFFPYYGSEWLPSTVW